MKSLLESSPTLTWSYKTIHPSCWGASRLYDFRSSLVSEINCAHSPTSLLNSNQWQRFLLCGCGCRWKSPDCIKGHCRLCTLNPFGAPRCDPHSSRTENCSSLQLQQGMYHNAFLTCQMSPHCNVPNPASLLPLPDDGVVSALQHLTRSAHLDQST